MKRLNIIFYTIPVLMFSLMFFLRYTDNDILWGINHFRFLDNFYFIILTTIFSLLFILSLSEKYSNKFITILQHGLNSKKTTFLFLSIISIAIFYIFRCKTFFLGDGYICLSTFSFQNSYFVKPTEFLSSHIVRFIQFLLGEYSKDSALLAFQLLSYFSGIIFLYYIYKIVSTFVNNKNIQTLTYSTFIFSGVLQLFFGYVEFYPILWAIATSICYYSLLYLSQQKFLLRIILLYIIGLLIHTQLIVWLPAIIYIILNNNKITLGLEKIIRKNYNNSIAWFMLILFLFISSLYLLPSSKFLLPLFTAKPEAPNYYVFSLAHLIDILNLTLLVFPGFLIVVLLNMNRFKNKFDKLDILLMLISIPSLLFLLLIDPELGLARDWDLLSLTIFAPMLFLCRRLDASDIKIRSNHILLYTSLNLILLTAFITINNNKEFSSLRYKSIIRNYEGIKFFNSWSILSDYYNNNGDIKSRKKLDIEIENRFPEFIESLKAQQYLFTNKLDKALAISNRLVSAYPNHPNFIDIQGKIFFKKRKYDSAEYYFNKGLAIQHYNASFLFELGRIYFDQNKLNKAESFLKQAAIINPLNETSNEILSACYIKQNKFPETLEIGKKILSQDPKSASGHFIMLRYYYFQNKLQSAKIHYNYFLKYGQSRFDYSYIKNKYKHLNEK